MMSFVDMPSKGDVMANVQSTYIRVQNRSYVPVLANDAAALSYIGLPEDPQSFWAAFWNSKLRIRLPRTPGMRPIWLGMLRFKEGFADRTFFFHACNADAVTGELVDDGGKFMRIASILPPVTPPDCNQWVSGWHFPMPAILCHVEEAFMLLHDLGRVK